MSDLTPGAKQEAYLTGLLDAAEGLQNAMDVAPSQEARDELHAIFERLHAMMDDVPGFRC